MTDIRALAIETLTTHRHGEDGAACEWCASFYGWVLDRLTESGFVLVDADSLDAELRDMGEVWGGSAAWLTTGAHAADLMADVVAEVMRRSRG